MTDIDVLICYRGRFKSQVERLDKLLATHNLGVTFDAEILTPDVDYLKADIEWISLGLQDGGDDTRWRAPISEAVKRSKLVVFLIDTQDRSENVMNEIAWAARSGKPLFIVFNTKGDGHSEDWEGINLGMLEAYYGLVANNPEMPRFGYHFITHDENEGLEDRLTILVNRILSYFDLVQRDAVPRYSLDHETTLADVEASPSIRARRQLREVQQRLANALGQDSSPYTGDMLQVTLEKLHARERDGETRDGRIYPRNSPFSYPEQSERERYRLTEALINKIRPGPFESPDFLVMFARELVSLQMVLGHAVRPVVLIGTIPLAPSNQQVDVILRPDYCVLLVDSSQADFVYQMLKSAVLSWKITSQPGHLPVSMSTRVEDTREVITQSPGLVEGFARSLRRMLEQGIPGSSTSGQPPPAYHPTLSTLIVFQKRFSVAAALARILVLDAGPSAGKISMAEEKNPEVMSPGDWVLAADALAAHLVFESAASLDSVDPTIAYQAILLGLAAQSLIERSIDRLAPLEIIPGSRRMNGVATYFADYLLQGRMPQEAIEQRVAGPREVATTLVMLLEEAATQGYIDPAAIRPSTRWRRNLVEQD